MSNKSEQINIRISSILKTELQKTAETMGISASDLIRESLENVIRQDDSKKLAELEKKLEKKWDLMQRKIIMASATIVSIDTGYPIDFCIKTTLKLTENMPNMESISRTELERLFLEKHNQMSKELGVSETAKMMISIILNTHIATIFSEDVFSPTPLSMLTMERVRKALDQKK